MKLEAEECRICPTKHPEYSGQTEFSEYYIEYLALVHQSTHFKVNRGMLTPPTVLSIMRILQRFLLVNKKFLFFFPSSLIVILENPVQLSSACCLDYVHRACSCYQTQFSHDTLQPGSFFFFFGGDEWFPLYSSFLFTTTRSIYWLLLQDAVTQPWYWFSH